MNIRPGIFPKPKYQVELPDGYYLIIKNGKNAISTTIELTPYLGTQSPFTTFGVINKESGKAIDIDVVLKSNNLPFSVHQKLGFSYFVGYVNSGIFTTDVTLMYKGIKLGEI